MYEFIKTYQLDFMLLLCGACAIFVFLLINTRFLTKSRKLALIVMESVAFCLLFSDRLAYIFSGDTSQTGFIMVRVVNFLVFFFTSGSVFGFNLYLSDLVRNEGKAVKLPKRLHFVTLTSVLGMLMSVVAAFTDLYYYFDEMNVYHRGQGFLIAYIIPVLCPIIQYTVFRQYKKQLSKLIYISLNLFIFVPIICGLLQIFTYGISIVNISMAVVSISLYIFMYLDMNNTVQHAHQIEIENMQGEQARMKRLFEQTATAFVSAVEKKDDFVKGNALRIAEYARQIAELAGKSEEDCEKVYYAALLHDVGLIGIPDSVIKNDEDPDKWDYEAIKEKPAIGAEILSSITEYPYLSQGAGFSHERYNGTGYPNGLKGEQIPEIARIIAVADAYVTMTTRKRYRDARPVFVAREAFVKGGGEVFDPYFAEIMVRIIDEESRDISQDEEVQLENEIVCNSYREKVSSGIPVSSEVKRISFDCELSHDEDVVFSAPSIVLFDAYDRRVHDNAKAIKGYSYMEYGEVWFDKYSIETEARKIKETILEAGSDITLGSAAGADRDDTAAGKSAGEWKEGHYEILAGRYEDHLKLVMQSRELSKEVTVVLPNGSKSAYIGITGENCRIYDISAESMDRIVGPGEIERIVDSVSYIDHLESDIRNVQVSRTRSDNTEGIEIVNKLRLAFHTMTLPEASLVWNCPYVVIYTSEDGQVDGPGYKEYTLIKLNGENDVREGHAVNRFSMKKTEDFSGWDDWKAINKRGLDCELYVERKGNRISMKTENLGIYIESVTTINEDVPKVYMALTGDQVALTDIRLM